MNCQQNYNRTVFLLFIVSFFSLFFLFHLVTMTTGKDFFDFKSLKYITREEIFALGIPDTENHTFITEIKKDLKIEGIDVKILFGPYLHTTGSGMLVISNKPLRYHVLLDKNIYDQLEAQEKKALIAHEMGHILNKTTYQDDKETTINMQVEADNYAALKTSPDTVINLLKKIFSAEMVSKHHPEYTKRVQNLENLKKSKQAQ